MTVTINGTTNTELNLDLLHREIASPEAKVNKVSIPLSDGEIDLTDVLSGIPRFANREILMNFEIRDARSAWMTTMSNLRKAFHGKNVRVVFSDDSSYYWEGRCAVGTMEDHGFTAGITLTIDALPFKKTVADFYDETITVDGETEVVISNTCMRGYPTFIPSSEMTVSDGTETFTITQTVNKAYGLQFLTGTNTIVLNGSGTCRVKVQGGEL